MKLQSLPTLDEIAKDPSRVDVLPFEARRALATKAAMALVLLMEPAPAEPVRRVPDLLDAETLAGMIGVHKSWVYRHVDALPQRVSVVGTPRWRRDEIERWMETRPRWAEEVA